MRQRQIRFAPAATAIVALALFHTIFNVLGVLLMWPLADHLTRWLQARFRAREEDDAGSVPRRQRAAGALAGRQGLRRRRG